MKKLVVMLLLSGISAGTFAQQRPATPLPTTPTPTGSLPGTGVPRMGPRPYRDIITDKAVSQKGLFIVHKVDDKFFFEIPDSIFGREILAVTRISRTATGAGYGGEIANNQSLRFEKGPDNRVFLRVVSTINVAKDSSQPISQAVKNSNVEPITAAFDIKAFRRDTTGAVIEVTDFFRGDNQVVSLNANTKRRYNFSSLAPDRSYIERITTFPMNTEIKTVKTFNASPAGGMAAPSPFPSPSLPAANAAGAVTLELNTSMLLLPRVPMARRAFDPRVGYFADDFVVYDDKQQKVENSTFAVRWRLEPKDADIEKYNRGELVEPIKPIIYYIDPATPHKWRKFLIQGINDWQVAFEAAGFKNAIIGQEWPLSDTSMSLDDARFSVLRYFASDIENAYGPNVHDPRSGEILESHIGWYHNVMKLLHDWYMIQAGPVDPRARKMVFDDDLMGELIRFVSSHEVGHTLGLRHNMGSSSKTPVEKLRDKAWVEANGHTASIMDYARFNYVAQPEDNITAKGLYPRIGEYDKWAIEWGYKWLPTRDVEEDKKVTNKWVIERLKNNPRIWFGGEGQNLDPRAQTEDLSDNSVKASEYGIKNLKRVIQNLPEWTKEEADKYENLQVMYTQVVGQFNRYMNHVAKNVGGIQETFKSVEEPGDVYSATPEAAQKDAVTFISQQLFQTPTWLINKELLNKFSAPSTNETVQTLQANVLNSLLSGARLNRMLLAANRFGGNLYTADELMTDVKNSIWSEVKTKRAIDPLRRNLQKTYVDVLVNLINPQTPTVSGLPAGFTVVTTNIKNTDIPSIARAYLRMLNAEITAAIPATTDKMSKYHLQDVSARIQQALDPKN
ncbi:MAG: zinc-dependent metalloprotease [Segetibacter sp.]|nr:zinc-dependent metalloprotease [Segetibacter sp.]